MIETEVHGPSRANSLKCVYYRSQTQIIRKALFDEKGVLVRDYLYEYSEKGLLDSISMYAKDSISLIGLKEYSYYDDSRRIRYTEEFKFENGKKFRTQRADHLFDDVARTSTVTVFGSDDEPLGYELYGFRGNDDFMSLLGFYDMNHEQTSYASFGLGKDF